MKMQKKKKEKKRQQKEIKIHTRRQKGKRMSCNTARIPPRVLSECYIGSSDMVFEMSDGPPEAFSNGISLL